MAFRYLKDPLFIACLTAYGLNCGWDRLNLQSGWLNSYLNDVICIPFCVPIMLFVQRRVGLRWHDGPPEASEIVIPLVVWSVVFESLLPHHSAWQGKAVGDPVDIVCYAAGALAASLFWRFWYNSSHSQPHVRPTSVGTGSFTLRHPDREQLLQISPGTAGREGPTIGFCGPANPDGSAGLLPRWQLGLDAKRQPYLHRVEDTGRSQSAFPAD